MIDKSFHALTRLLALGAVPAAVAACTASETTSSAAATPAAKVFVGGPIVTVDDAKPGAEAIAVRDGTVNTIDDLVKKLQESASGPDVGRTGWGFGLGHDDALFGHQPSRDDVDIEASYLWGLGEIDSVRAAVVQAGVVFNF